MRPFSKRVLIGPTLALVLVAGTALWVAPFVLAARRMERFCSELPVGASSSQVQALAVAGGYELSTPSDAHTVLTDPLSYGRRQCVLEFGPGGLTAARYAGNGS